MKILNMTQGNAPAARVPYAGLLTGLLVLTWPLLQQMIRWDDLTAGAIDPAVWLLILLGFGLFLVLLGLVWWLLQRYWLAFGLPDIELMVSQFNRLDLWQQLKFYYAFFALLLLAGLGCLAAIL